MNRDEIKREIDKLSDEIKKLDNEWIQADVEDPDGQRANELKDQISAKERERAALRRQQENAANAEQAGIEETGGSSVEDQIEGLLADNDFAGAADLLDGSDDVSLSDREALGARIDAARRRALATLKLDVGRATRRNDFDKARELLDAWDRGVGHSDDPVVRGLRNGLAEQEVKYLLRVVLEELELGKPPEYRDLRVPAGLQGKVYRLRDAQKDPTLANVHGAIADAINQFEAENARRTADLKLQGTKALENKWVDVLRQAQEDERRGLTTFPDFSLDLNIVENERGELQVDLIPISQAIQFLRAKVTETATRGLRNRLDEAERALAPTTLDLLVARGLVNEARAQFGQSADESSRQALEAVERRLSTLEAARVAFGARLSNLDREPSIDVVLTVLTEVQREDPPHPALPGAAADAVERFLARLAATLKMVGQQPVETRVPAVAGLAAQADVLYRLLSFLPAKAAPGTPHAPLREAVESLRAALGEAEVRAAADLAQARAWSQARDQMSRWIRLDERDVNEAERLLTALQDDPSEEARALRERATPLLGVGQRVAEAMRCARRRDLEGARDALESLRREPAAAISIRTIEAAVQRVEQFVAARAGIEEGTVEGLARAEQMASRLSSGTVATEAPDPAEVASLRQLLERLRTDADTAQQAMAGVRRRLDDSEFEVARRECLAIASQVRELQAEQRSLLASINGRWRATLVADVRAAVVARDSEHVCTALERFASAFPDAGLDGETSSDCFEVLAQTWEASGSHVARIERALVSARIVITGPEARDRVAAGGVVLGERRDLPAITVAVANRDEARAKALLEGLPAPFMDRDDVLGLRVEVNLLALNFESARVWAQKLSDPQVRQVTIDRVIEAERVRRERDEFESRISRYMSDLGSSRDVERVAQAFAEGSTRLADDRLVSLVPGIRDRWDQAVRALEARLLNEIDGQVAGMPLGEAVRPFSLLKAIERLPTVSESAIQARISNDWVAPVQREIVKTNTILQMVNMQQEEVSAQLERVEQLQRQAKLLGDWVPQPSRARIRRAERELAQARDDIDVLATQHATFTRQVQEALQSDLHLNALQSVATAVPARFTGNPPNRLVVEMRTRLAELRQEWDRDEDLIAKITRAWNTGDYRLCERLAGDAASEVLSGRDRFGRKAAMTVSEDGETVRGAAAIRTECTQKRALMAEWQGYVEAVERSCPNPDEVKALAEDFAAGSKTRATALRVRLETLRDRCNDAVGRIKNGRPVDTTHRLSDASTTDWRRRVEAADRVLAQHLEFLQVSLATLDDDARRCEQLRQAVEEKRVLMERSRHPNPLLGLLLGRRDPEAVYQYDEAVALLRATCPNG